MRTRTTPRKGRMTRALTAAALVLGIGLTGVAPAYAEGIGGSTGGTGDSTGSNGSVVGNGTPPGGTAPGPGGVSGGSFDSFLGHDTIWKYSYNPTPKCAQGVAEKHEKQPNGSYKVTEVTCIGGEPAYDVVLYKNYCVAQSTIKIQRLRPTPSELFNETRSTIWGAGERSIEACDASHKIKFGKVIKPETYGHYRSQGATTLDFLYVKHYTSKTSDGRTIPDSYHSWKPAKKVNSFENYGTLRCANDKGEWVPRLVDYAGSDSCGGGLLPPPKTPPTSTTPPQVTTGSSFATCKVPGPATLDGHGEPVSVLRDGKSHAVKWTGGKGQPTITGKGVSQVKGLSTRFEVWNAPINPRPSTGNLFELESGKGKDLLRKQWKADSKGLGVTGETQGIVTDSSLRFYKTTARDIPALVNPVWKFSAVVETPTVVIENMDPFTGEMETSTTITKKRAEMECRGGAVSANVVKVMNDRITG